MQKRYGAVSWIVVFGLASLMGSVIAIEGAQAASYGDFSTTGGEVDFNGVEDDTGAFGAPTPTANGLDFDALQLSASCGVVAGSCPAGGTENVSEGLRLEISAGAADAPSAIVIRQTGRTTLLASGGETAISVISTNVFIDIFEVDGTPVNNINFSDFLTFDSSGSFSASDATGGLDDVAFSGEITIDLAAILAAHGATGAATLIAIGSGGWRFPR